jgi:diguanylate cyclase (GGDEF)-like protein/PAS domain S-box-containing protein
MRDLSQIIEQLPIGVAVTTPMGSIEYANPHLCRMLALDAERLEGVNLADLRALGGASKSDHLRLRLLAGESWHEDAQFRTGNGETIHVLESAYPLRDLEGRVMHFVHLLQDLALMKVSETLRSLAFYDRLTGLPSRNLFQNRLALAIAGARRARHGFAVLSANIDRFKLVNESLGRDAGDELLRQVAARLRACVRETDTVARLGGDEFVAILDRLLDPELAKKTADKLLAACCGDYEIGGNRLRVTISMGLSLYPRDGQEAEILLKRADLAMYRAKASGRGRTELRDSGVALRYGFAWNATLSDDDALRVDEAQPRPQLRGHMHYAVRVDEQRARHAHARGRFPPAARAFDEDRLGGCVG